MDPFSKSGKRGDILGGFDLSMRPKQYTVVVLYNSGYQKEYKCIEKPWQYMAKIKTNPQVKSTWIKQ